MPREHMPCKRILIVEDDAPIAKLERHSLEQEGFDCVQSSSGEAALDMLEKQLFDLIMLDIGLPGIDGFEVCRRIRQDNRLKHIPIIMLTSRADEVDRVVGLELGADDYVAKPFSPRELALRAKAILKRMALPEPVQETLVAEILTIDRARHKVLVKDVEIELTPMEFNLLVTLLQRKGRVQSRDTLLSDVWDIHEGVSTRTVDTHIKRLREKLGAAGDMIETVTGIGYRFKE